MNRTQAVEIVAEMMKNLIERHKFHQEMRHDTKHPHLVGTHENLAEKLAKKVEAIAVTYDMRVGWPGPFPTFIDIGNDSRRFRDFKDALAAQWGYRSFVEMIGKEGK